MNEFDFDYQEQRPRGRNPIGIVMLVLVTAAITFFITYSLMNSSDGGSVASISSDGQAATQAPADVETLATPPPTGEAVTPSVTAAPPEETERPQTAPALGGPIPQILGGESGVSQVVEKMGDAVVGIETAYEKGANTQAIGSGSGFIITADGYIATNAHVIENGNKFKVHLTDDEILDATLVGSDSSSDIAVLKIDKKGLTAAAFGDSKKIKVGELAIVIGNPLEEALSNSVSMGIISGLNREVTSNKTDFSRVGISLIQTDAAVNPGNSGGPLVSVKGEVIGITTAKSFTAGTTEMGANISSEGIGFAIPISDAKAIIEKLIVDGKFDRGGLGITLMLVDEETAKTEKTQAGVTIASIYKDSPAEKAGLKEGDVVISIDGQKVSRVEELTQFVLSKSAGDKVKLVVFRDGKETSVDVTLGNIDELTQQENELEQQQQGQQGFPDGGGGGNWDNENDMPMPWWFSW